MNKPMDPSIDPDTLSADPHLEPLSPESLSNYKFDENDMLEELVNINNPTQESSVNILQPLTINTDFEPELQLEVKATTSYLTDKVEENSKPEPVDFDDIHRIFQPRPSDYVIAAVSRRIAHEMGSLITSEVAAAVEACAHEACRECAVKIRKLSIVFQPRDV